MGEMDEDIHLAIHREADELGKFATQIKAVPIMRSQGMKR